MSLISEFREFLNEYKVIGLAVAFIIGAALTSLVKALVDDIIMPIILFMQPKGDWKGATLDLGPIVFLVGDFISQLIYFLIIAFVVFLIAKYVLREEKVTKK